MREISGRPSWTARPRPVEVRRRIPGCRSVWHYANSGGRWSTYLSGGFAVRSSAAHPPRLDRDDLAGRPPTQLPAQLMNETMVAPTQQATLGEVCFPPPPPLD